MEKRLDKLPEHLKNKDTELFQAKVKALVSIQNENSMLAQSGIDPKILASAKNSDAEYKAQLDKLNEYYQSDAFTQYSKALEDFVLFYDDKGLQIATFLNTNAPPLIAGEQTLSSLTIEPAQRVGRLPLFGNEISKQVAKSKKAELEKLYKDNPPPKFTEEDIPKLSEDYAKDKFGAGLGKAKDAAQRCNDKQQVIILKKTFKVNSVLTKLTSRKERRRKKAIDKVDKALGVIIDARARIISGDVDKELKGQIKQANTDLKAAIEILVSTTDVGAKEKVAQGVLNKMQPAIDSLKKQLDEVAPDNQRKTENGKQQAEDATRKERIPAEDAIGNDGFGNDEAGVNKVALNSSATDSVNPSEIPQLFTTDSKPLTVPDSQHEVDGMREAITRDDLNEDEQNYLSSLSAS